MKTHKNLQRFTHYSRLQNHDVIYDGPIFQVHQLEVKQADKILKRQVVHKHAVVAILATDRQNRLVLVKQDRPAIGQACLEIPAGIRDVQVDGQIEQGLIAAQRELEEECALISDQWTYLMEAYTSPGFTDEHLTLYRAQKVQVKEHARRASDTDEISWDFYSRREVEALLKKNKIQDLKTYTAIQLWLKEEEDETL